VEALMKSALVITASNRASAGVYEDKSGKILVEGLENLGYQITESIIVPDNLAQISGAIKSGIEKKIDLIVTTGGTGVSPMDITPEATAPLIEKILPGFSEALRAYARDKVPTTDLSRAIAGVTDKSLIVNLPGSPGGVKDGLVILERLASHIHDQVAGHDHSASN
jgi:molybdenum cofactor synthesis domain-containing protein